MQTSTNQRYDGSAPSAHPCSRQRGWARVLRVPAAVALTLAASTGCSAQWVSMTPDLASRTSAATATSRATGSAATTNEQATEQATEHATEQVTAQTTAKATAKVTTAEPVAAAAPTGDLARGSAKHVLSAGARTLVVDYWTGQDPGTWTADTRPVIQLSAHLRGGSTRNVVKVTRFTASLDGQSLTDDRGEFVITRPFSYGSALQLPALAASTHTSTVTVQFDLLIETAAGSKQYFRQTILDSLALSFASKDNS